MFSCFFFFKQKTAYEMRISDWSSDVCSSDLIAAAAPLEHRHARAAMADLAARLDARRNLDLVGVAIGIGNLDHPAERGGREADRRARVERGALAIEQRMPRDIDRKSTRLNSSH